MPQYESMLELGKGLIFILSHENTQLGDGDIGILLHCITLLYYNIFIHL